jgi:hypothetical protein
MCHYSRAAQRVLSALGQNSLSKWRAPLYDPPYHSHSSKLDPQEVSQVSSGAMDFTYLADVLPTSTQELVWWSCFSLLTLVVFKILLHSNAEDAIEFSVPVPEACRAGWEGKQLDDPSIKVCSDEEVKTHSLALVLILNISDIWQYSRPMLQSSNRKVPWSSQSRHGRRSRSHRCKGQ